jgi:hypothetical protein
MIRRAPFSLTTRIASFVPELILDGHCCDDVSNADFWCVGLYVACGSEQC